MSATDLAVVVPVWRDVHQLQPAMRPSAPFGHQATVTIALIILLALLALPCSALPCTAPPPACTALNSTFHFDLVDQRNDSIVDSSASSTVAINPNTTAASVLTSTTSQVIATTTIPSALSLASTSTIRGLEHELINFTKTANLSSVGVVPITPRPSLAPTPASPVPRLDSLGPLRCEYGTLRKYYVNSLVQWKLMNSVTTKATLLVKCLNQITWGVDELQDRLNGQKYLVYITDLQTSPTLSLALGEPSTETRRRVRAKRGLYRYFEHIWNDFKHMLTVDGGGTLPRNQFDNEMLQSMESELNIKCHMPAGSFVGHDPKYYQYQYALDECATCNQSPLTKVFLPFWFIQLEDGSIPQIRFSKQETNLEVKNFKKFIASLFVTQLNVSNANPSEKTVFGVHQSHYIVSNWTNSALPDNISARRVQIDKHITTRDLSHTTSELGNPSGDFGLDFELNQTQMLDTQQQCLVTSISTCTFQVGLSELKPYIKHTNQFSLKKSLVYDRKSSDVMKLANERYSEAFKETLVAQPYPHEATLEEKYNKLLSQLRTRLGKNEYRYYTTLYEFATSKMRTSEHDMLLELVNLEQQLNHTGHQQNSLIGDVRRIGTVHNIQLVCGLNLVNLDHEKCTAFLYLLLRSSSKTAQRDLLYTLQGHESNSAKQVALKISAVRLLQYTSKPSRWLIENLAHEAHHQSANRPMETVLLQTLSLLAHNEQLLKLRELLSVHIVRRVAEVAAEPPTLYAELYLFDLIKMLGNLDNYTAVEVARHSLSSAPWSESSLVTMATINAYRRSINRSQVQSYLGDLFLHHNSCQIKQEIVQLLIDGIDLVFWEQSGEKRWPKYGFSQLDQMLAHNLRNSSNNCVHHLIVEYFKRKVNSNAQNFIKEYETRQNFNSSSFDFCIREADHVKCDYVQQLGTELASLAVTKSVIVPKVMLDMNNTSAIANVNKARSRVLYSKYSINLSLLKQRLTLGHLNVILSSGDPALSRYLHLEFDTYRGQALPVARVELPGELSCNASLALVAPVKVNMPDVVAWTERYLHFDHSLLIHANLIFSVKLKSEQAMGSWQSKQTVCHKPELQINIDVHTTGDVLSSSLTSRSSIELSSKFEYQSVQPIQFGADQAQLSSTMQINSTGLPAMPEENPINLESLGSEQFHHEIQLFQEFNKRYDTECNAWMDESFRQMLYHWNSTLVQRNSLSLPVVTPEVRTISDATKPIDTPKPTSTRAPQVIAKSHQ